MRSFGLVIWWAYGSAFRSPIGSFQRRWSVSALYEHSSDCEYSSLHRRVIVSAIAVSQIGNYIPPAQAANPFSRFALSQPNGLFVVGPGVNASQSLQKGPFVPSFTELSSELCLLKLLPVKKPLFRELEAILTSLSELQNPSKSSGAWNDARNATENAIASLDNRRLQLEPVFNPEDNSLLQINKGERSERLIEALRSRMVQIVNITENRNSTKMFEAQKKALLALSEVGELLVENFPYGKKVEGSNPSHI